jgi:hypothetical protein
MAKKKIKYLGVDGTQEFINLVKADLAKKQDIIQFTEMPSPIECIGRVYEYVGETNMYFQNGHFYHSNGFNWSEVYKGIDGKTWGIFDRLPPYDMADFETIYFIYTNGALEGYIKGETRYEQITSSHTWDIVSAKPRWEDADNDVIYFIIDRGRLQGYVKNEEEPDAWYELGGKVNFNELDNIPSINGISLKNEAEPDSPKEISLNAKVQKYPESAHWDEHAAYPAAATPVPVNEIELQAFTDTEIEQVFDDVM